MAESDSGQERSEEPTQKRMFDAREKGDIARSKELNTAAILLTGSGALIFFGHRVAQGLAAMMHNTFEISRDEIYATSSMMAALSDALTAGLTALMPVFIALLIAAVVGPVALGGWVMSGKALAPKWSRLSPLAGIKRMFSGRALMELAKAMGKFLLVATLAVLILEFITPDLFEIGKKDTLAAMKSALDTFKSTQTW